MNKINFIRFAVAGIVFFVAAAHGFAADGSGSASISPTSTTVGATSTTFTVTYIASEAMNDGGIRLQIPSGWPAPQNVSSGTAAYTTVSTTGTTGAVINALDSASGWDDNATMVSVSADTSVKKEGAASLKATVTAASASARVFYNFASAQNWSTYTKLSFWFRANAELSAGKLALLISESTNLSGAARYELPNGLLDGMATSTWTHVVVDLTAQPGSSRDAVRSYGFALAPSVLSNFYFDNIVAGPAAPTISGQTVDVPLLELPVNGSVTITYGAGGGTGGVEVPGPLGTATFTVSQRTHSGGTYTSLASSPTVAVAGAGSLHPTVGATLADITLFYNNGHLADCHLYKSDGTWLADCSIMGSYINETLNAEFSGFLGPNYAVPGDYLVVLENDLHTGCSQVSLADCRVLEGGDPNYQELPFILTGL